MKQFTIVLFVIFSFVCTAQESKNTKALNNTIEQGMKDWKIPGLTAIVVKDGETVFKKSYGIRNINTNEKVDDNTLFNMGSTTKAMVAMAMGMLVDDEKIQWDDKVQKYLPEFQLSDPYISKDARVVDLFTHNLGIGGADALWSLDSVPTSEVISRFKYANASYPLRGGFIYQNIMYAVAGEVIEKVSGQHWADYITGNLFKPLQMNRTQARSKNIFSVGNYVSPHKEDANSNQYRVDHVLSDQIGAAGMIWTSANDIENYLKFLTNEGIYKGDTLLKPSTFNYLFEPKTILTDNGRYPTNALSKPKFNTYAMGWFQQDYRGQKLNFHTGSLPGLIAIAGYIQEEDFAVYIIANMDHAELRHAILYKAIDLFVFDDDSRDWHQEVFDLYKGDDQNDNPTPEDNRVKGTSPSLELQEYTGTYRHDLIGTFKISMNENALDLTINDNLKSELVHWHYDTFMAEKFEKFEIDIPINFHLDFMGKVSKLEVYGESFVRVE